MKLATGAVLMMMSFTALAQNDSALLEYVPQQQVTGTLRVWGHGASGKDYIGSLVRKWEAGFEKLQPGVHFEDKLYGTASALGSLYTGTGDIAVMGREIWPAEKEAFLDVKGYPPVGVDVVTGSVDIRNKEFALTFVVNRTNPLAHLSLQQVRDVFSVTSHKVTTWGDLGVSGEWARRPVHVYGFEISRGFGYYLQQRAFGGSSIWNPELVELADQPRREGGLYDAGQRVVDAVAKDPDGIGFSSALYRSAEVRVVPLGRTAEGPFLLPTHVTVGDHSYPLVQVITAFYDPKGPQANAVREFLHYVLSEQGQQAVREEGDFTPLTPRLAQESLHEMR
ncbi:MAG TPA: substrate-binding domain-containing protein [Acidobacteriaceae bacterium]|nr:substrate-binding domain-containing protein [Acidobacteriaceae bacterium]